MKMFLSRYGTHDARSLMREHEEFEVETIIPRVGKSRECKRSSPWRTHCQLQDEAS